MNAYVTDTHALIWHLTADARLSAICREIFEAADRGDAKIWIPSIVLVETVYLAEKARFPDALVTQMLGGRASSRRRRMPLLRPGDKRAVAEFASAWDARPGEISNPLRARALRGKARRSRR